MPRKKPSFDYIAPQLQSLAVPIKDLQFDPKNARRHSDENVSAVRASLDRFGQYLPIVVQKQGMIIRIGNCRTQAASDLGWSHVAAVVVDESDVDAVARAITDNRTGELGDWDWDNLTSSIQAMDLGLDDLGWAASELEAMLSYRPPEVDETPQYPEAPPEPPGQAEAGPSVSDSSGRGTLTLDASASSVLRAHAEALGVTPSQAVLDLLRPAS